MVKELMRIISGIQPSGKLHLGNYFGAMAQFLELQNKGECLFFIANLHALTTVREGLKLKELTQDLALDFLALGLDPQKATLFCQADVVGHAELLWYLSVVTPMGLLERAHSYKDKTARGFGTELGLFSYPVLMAADILLYGAEQVPVGKDQTQHLEMARDIATKFNLAFVPGYKPTDPEGKQSGVPGILKLPTALVQEETAVVPGIDGEKMSKSYGNVIELFAEEEVISKKIMAVKTDSTPPHSPKEPAGPLFTLLKLLAKPEEIKEIETSFREGGKGYGFYKQQLVELFHTTFGPARARRKELAKDRRYVRKVLDEGAEKARAAAAPLLHKVRQAMGMSLS